VPACTPPIGGRGINAWKGGLARGCSILCGEKSFPNMLRDMRV